jgi:diguanylate cyclase (GGDEF)-like protein
VDHFKKVNDSHGHPMGDLVLQRVAEKLQDTVRTEDTLARFGGEEFAVLLRETDQDRAFVAGERLRRAVELMDATYKNMRVPVTVSVGLATLSPKKVATPEELVEAADQALYDAKKAGRNRMATRRVT